jgi:hypothetical protein
MPGFLYYLPGKNSVKLPDAQAAGLGYAFEKSCLCRGCAHGPDGDDGATFAATDANLGFWREQQTWRKIPGSPAWAGYFNDAKPTPADLVREHPLFGHTVELCDGQKWTVPLARQAFEHDGAISTAVNLPERADLDESGNWVLGAVDSKYADLWKTACAFWDSLIGAETAEGGVRMQLNLPSKLDAAVTALQANYRIGRIEAAMLGILNDVKVDEVLIASGYDTRKEP